MNGKSGINGETRILILSEVYEHNCSEYQTVEVSDEVYQLLMDFKKEDNRYKMKTYRYHTPFGFDEVAAAEMCGKFSQSAEDTLYESIRNTSLYNAIRQLSKTNQRRFWLYVVEDLTLEEIAELEGVSINAVSKSIRYSKQILRKLLTDCEDLTISDFNF